MILLTDLAEKCAELGSTTNWPEAITLIALFAIFGAIMIAMMRSV